MKTQEWQHICKVVNDAQRAAMHCSIATVDQHMQPTICPISTLFLKDHQNVFSLIPILNRCNRICRKIAKPAFRQSTVAAYSG
ncbi:hypothetical protein SAMN05421732_104152 [Acinetobacter kookii]|uniref:Uncharacterized protein n=1 Tax=Acinetobacter kookii TaxID=1226327 RepID=A0A1G6K2L7_9GAMM|nr:hypothetical protein SAMN05421732_104152 [Acinetobacter kookii]